MFEIEQAASGSLWIMPCPEGMQLAQDVRNYRQRGADRIVSMLATEEAAQLGLAGEAEACADAGLAFEHHPIADFGVPDLRSFTALVNRIYRWLGAGQSVAVHCRAGIGRSGMVTAGVLVMQGLSAEDAMAKVADARGVSIPDTVEQGRFIALFAERIRS
ncbi:MAG: protein-tyrosine phosphatase family protein [Sulfitobacter sp.]